MLISLVTWQRALRSSRVATCFNQKKTPIRGLSRLSFSGVVDLLEQYNYPEPRQPTFVFNKANRQVGDPQVDQGD